MTQYLTDGQNDNLALTKDFEQKLALTLNGLPSADVTLDAFNFDIGVEGQTALVSGVATILDPLSPQQIQILIPALTFSETHNKLILQIRWTESGENERIILKRFLDVREPVTPKP